MEFQIVFLVGILTFTCAQAVGKSSQTSNPVSPESPPLTSINPENGASPGEAGPPAPRPRPSIGRDRSFQYFCLFFGNFTYKCKSGCADTDQEGISQSIPEASYLKYMDRNCTKDEEVENGGKWKPNIGIITRRSDRQHPHRVIASCTFYTSLWYECYGVGDCRNTEGVTVCGGGAPWRGYYDGDPLKGNLHGNVTAEAQNSPPMIPQSSGSNNDAPQLPLPKKSVIATCEKFLDTRSYCYSRNKTCSGTPEKQQCSQSRPVIRQGDPLNQKFDSIISMIEQKSVSQANDIVATCYFYDIDDYLCSFPFSVNFNGDVPMRFATGTFYRNK